MKTLTAWLSESLRRRAEFSASPDDSFECWLFVNSLNGGRETLAEGFGDSLDAAAQNAVLNATVAAAQESR